MPNPKPKAPTHTRMDRDAVVAVLLPLRHVEDGTQVFKETGQKRYTVRRTFAPYGGPATGPAVPPIRCGEGTVFLFDEEGGCTTWRDDRRVRLEYRAWQVVEIIRTITEESRR